MINRKRTLIETHGYLLPEWDDEKDFSHMTQGSDYVANWKCSDYNHKWKAQIRARTRRGRECPYCNYKKVLIGFNDLSTTHKNLVAEWADKKDIKNFLSKSHYKAKWRCEKGHFWKAVIYARAKDRNPTGCPYCSGREVTAGDNDLETTHAYLKIEWFDQRDMRTVGYNSHYTATWKCKAYDDHIWEASVSNRTRGRGCPYCANRRVKIGFNDLATAEKHLISDWSDERSIYKFTRGSTYKAKWKCEKGHIWRVVISSRVKGSGCPKCNDKVSKAEQELYDYIVSLLEFETKVFQSDRTVLQGRELDIYLPKLNIAFEFNGEYWHTDKMIRRSYNISSYDYHASKKSMAALNGVALYFIWENDWNARRDYIKSEIYKLLTFQDFDRELFSRLS